MFALIRKDLLLHKGAFLGFGPVLVIFLSWLANQGDSRNAFVVFAAIYASILPMVFIAREDKFGAEPFICSLPVTRQKIALAKYFLSWVVAFVFSIVGFAAFSVFAPEAPLGFWSVGRAGRFLLVLTLCLGLMLPFLLRFGWLGMMVGLVGAQVLGIVALLITKAFKGSFRPHDFFNAVSNFIADSRTVLGESLFAVAALIAFCAVNFVSYKIAVAMYRRREL